jgi:hypothetical protein
VKPQNETPMGHAPPPPGDANAQSSLQLENRRFTYNELVVITNNFERVLGQGGFGKVYNGFLEDGTQVAVKMRSQTSNQGVREFLAEVEFMHACCIEISRLGIQLVIVHCSGSDLNTDSSQDSGVHDRLHQGWGVHGACLRVHVRRHPTRAHCRYTYISVIYDCVSYGVCTSASSNVIIIYL